MSVTIALIPIALAIAAHQAAKKEAVAAGHATLDVQTRMRDEKLLHRALEDLGCTVSARGMGSLRAQNGHLVVDFTRGPNDVLQAQFSPEVSPADGERFLQELDDEYARLVQEAVYMRLMERASSQGMAVESERVEADNSIVVTLRVQS